MSTLVLALASACQQFLPLSGFHDGLSSIWQRTMTSTRAGVGSDRHFRLHRLRMACSFNNDKSRSGFCRYLLLHDDLTLSVPALEPKTIRRCLKPLYSSFDPQRHATADGYCAAKRRPSLVAVFSPAFLVSCCSCFILLLSSHASLYLICYRTRLVVSFSRHWMSWLTKMASRTRTEAQQPQHDHRGATTGILLRTRTPA